MKQQQRLYQLMTSTSYAAQLLLDFDCYMVPKMDKNWNQYPMEEYENLRRNIIF